MWAVRPCNTLFLSYFAAHLHFLPSPFLLIRICFCIGRYIFLSSEQLFLSTALQITVNSWNYLPAFVQKLKNKTAAMGYCWKIRKIKQLLCAMKNIGAAGDSFHEFFIFFLSSLFQYFCLETRYMARDILSPPLASLVSGHASWR